MSASTVRAYRGDLVAFAEWAGRASLGGPEAVDRRVLRRYLAYLGTRRYARRTVARKASTLRRYFAWQVRSGRLAQDPSIGLSAPGGGGRLPRVLRADELEVLLDQPSPLVDDDDPAVRLRDDAVLELLYGSGLRVAELCALRPDDLRFDQATLRVWGKGTKQRQVPLSAPSLEALQGWCAQGRRPGPAALAGRRRVPQPSRSAVGPT